MASIASAAANSCSSSLRQLNLLGRRSLLSSVASSSTRSLHSSSTRLNAGSAPPTPSESASTSASASASGWAAGNKAPAPAKPSAAAQLAEVTLSATGTAPPPTITLPGSAFASSPSPASLSSGAGLPYSPTALPTTSDPLISAFINLLMRDGKKALATKQVLEMLRHLSSLLRTDPLPALAMAVERASPLVRMQTRKSGGKNVQVPLPLNERQSRRRGIVAILDASKKRGDREIAVRMAKEVCAVLEGQSSTLGKKEDVHKTATANRSNASVRI